MHTHLMRYKLHEYDEGRRRDSRKATYHIALDSSSIGVSRSSTKAAGSLVDSALGNNVYIASRVHMIRARA